MTDPAVAATVVLIFTLISAGMFIYQFYFFSGFHKPTGDVYCLPLKGFASGQVNQFCTASAFGDLLEANPQLILLEPDYLVSLYLLQSALKQTEADWVPLQLSDWLSAAKKKDEQVLADWKDFQWRFDLPADGFGSSTHSLTVGLIASKDNSDLFKSLKSLGGFTLFEEVSGVVHHDNSNSSSNSSTQPLHYFLINKDHQHLSGGNLQSKKGNSSSPPPPFRFFCTSSFCTEWPSSSGWAAFLLRLAKSYNSIWFRQKTQAFHCQTFTLEQSTSKSTTHSAQCPLPPMATISW